MGMTIVGQAAGLVGGYVLAGLVVRPPFTLHSLVESVDMDDLGVSVLKSVLLAAMIAVVCIREGLSVQASPREVPQAATRGVVRSMTICLVLNSFLSIYT
jgi:ABC-type transporter Mla maintaining outer membrane lipid asymmetry permease subunit MlaE